MKKLEYDRAKRAADEAKRIEKELRDSRREIQRVSGAAKIRAASNQNRARLALMNLQNYPKVQRSVKVRREIANKNAFDRRSK